MRGPSRPLRFTHPRVLGAAAVCAAALGMILLLGGGPPPHPAPAAVEVSAPPPATPVASTTTAAARTPAPPATSSVGAPPPAQPSPTAQPPRRSPSAAPTSPWRAVATQFAVAFTATPAAGCSWAAGLAPWVSPTLAAAYTHTNPDRRPEGRLLEVQQRTETATSVVATLDYDSGLRLAIELAPNSSGSWTVNTVLKAPAGG